MADEFVPEHPEGWTPPTVAENLMLTDGVMVDTQKEVAKVELPSKTGNEFNPNAELAAPREFSVDPAMVLSPEARLDDLEAKWDELLAVLKRTGLLHDDHLRLLHRVGA